MRRMALAIGTFGAVLMLTAAPAWAAPNAGQFCKNAEAGLTTTAANGRQVTCTLESGRYHWAYSAGTTPTTAATSGAVTANPAVAATSTARSGLASTGLNHTRQAVELAVVFLGLGVALVLEIRARDGLDRLRRHQS